MPACGQDWLSYKTQASQFHDNLRVPLPVVETALLLDARGWPVHRGLARRPRGREVRQSSRSITLPFDRKRRGIFAARLLVSCPLPCEHREDDVVDPLALEPEAPDHMGLLAETKPLHESDRAGVARVDGSGDAMLSKFAKQVADNGSQRFCGVPAALESRRHANSDFRQPRVVENVDTAIADQLSTGAECYAKLVPSSGCVRVHAGQFFKIGSELVHRCGFPRLVARYVRVRTIEQHELRVGGPKIPKDQSVGDDVLEHVLNPRRIERSRPKS